MYWYLFYMYIHISIYKERKFLIIQSYNRNITTKKQKKNQCILNGENWLKWHVIMLKYYDSVLTRCRHDASDWPAQLQDVKQHLFVFLVLLRPAGVQLEGRLLEERQSFGERSQLYQVQEVEVAEPLGSLASRQLRVKTLPELRHVVTPFLLKPAVCRWEGGLTQLCTQYFVNRRSHLKKSGSPI